MSRSRTLGLAALVAGFAAFGCHKAPADAAAVPSASASAAPLDRLAPGELLPGDQTVFGLLLPRGMGIGAESPGVTHVAGPLAPEDVANYIRDRVDIRRVELGAVGTFFPAVHITGGDPKRVFRIEVNPAGTGTEVVFRDVTPQPKPLPDPGVSDAERWRRAGYKPNGRPLDPMNLR